MKVMGANGLMVEPMRRRGQIVPQEDAARYRVGGRLTASRRVVSSNRVAVRRLLDDQNAFLQVSAGQAARCGYGVGDVPASTAVPEAASDDRFVHAFNQTASDVQATFEPVPMPQPLRVRGQVSAQGTQGVPMVLAHHCFAGLTSAPSRGRNCSHAPGSMVHIALPIAHWPWILSM